ncbi:hypothetical protein [Deinococcus sp. Leaf326]|uniref:hypothetical protein n=1 Tax=Deinococcus sp. Leaf326 TaxID=1736338 RepID=UPI0006F8D9B9|nr:hypothetical protein [Deinococcus sp. Leaf326]KQR17920.1 hypothetical protein ASF71_20245 [Deinococcus sp. Leaf326]
MKKLIPTLALLTALLLPTASAADMNITLDDAQAESYTLELGPGALATLTWPDPVKDVTVTRSGIIETKIVDNRVIIAGLSSNGNTPIQITTESGVRTWRVRMSSQQNGSIINVRVLPPKAEAPTTVVIGDPAPGADVTTASTSATGVQLGLTTNTKPAEPMRAEDLPEIKFSLARDGNVVVLSYTLKAGSNGVLVDERQLTASAGQVRPTLSVLRLQPHEVRYGTLSIQGAGQAGSALKVSWPYQIGTVAQTMSQQLVTP